MSDVGYYDDPELAAEEAAAAEQIARLAAVRQEVQAQTRGLAGDVGSFRAEQQLAADAAHIASVELATAQGGDFYSADVGQQVAPDGTVTYDFRDVHLKAAGIDFDAGTGTPPSAQTVIDWKRLSDGAVIADVYAYDNPAGIGELIASAFTPGTDLQAHTRRTIDHVNAIATVSAEAVSTVDGDYPRTIIDSKGRSNFLQIFPSSFVRATWGVGSVVIPAGVGAATGAVPHGLGKVPAGIWLTGSTTPFGGYGGAVLTPYGLNTVNFSVQATTTPNYASGVTVNFYWLAIA
jgi:hypothetical protein